MLTELYLPFVNATSLRRIRIKFARIPELSLPTAPPSALMSRTIGQVVDRMIMTSRATERSAYRMRLSVGLCAV
jgi:hypothetical protein